MLLVVLEEHHLFAAFEVALVPNIFNDNLGEQVLALSHGLPAGGTDSLAFSDLLKTSCANDVASWTAGRRTIPRDGEADWALHLGPHLPHHRSELLHLLKQFLLGERLLGF